MKGKYHGLGIPYWPVADGWMEGNVLAQDGQGHIGTLPDGSSLTWKDTLNVPCEDPVQQGVDEHHDNGQQEGVGIALLWALVQVVPLDANALLLVLGEVFATVAKGHA